MAYYLSKCTKPNTKLDCCSLWSWFRKAFWYADVTLKLGWYAVLDSESRKLGIRIIKVLRVGGLNFFNTVDMFCCTMQRPLKRV